MQTGSFNKSMYHQLTTRSVFKGLRFYYWNPTVALYKTSNVL